MTSSIISSINDREEPCLYNVKHEHYHDKMKGGLAIERIRAHSRKHVDDGIFSLAIERTNIGQNERRVVRALSLPFHYPWFNQNPSLFTLFLWSDLIEYTSSNTEIATTASLS
jgi:hypothetical protein